MIWTFEISREGENAVKLVAALKEFGFVLTEDETDLLIQDKNILRMGVPPVRLEILNFIDGIEFEKCFAEREFVMFDDVPVNLISLKNLKINKLASGRYKDLADLEKLP